AETTLPMYVPIMKPTASPITPALPMKSMNSAIIPFGLASEGAGFGVTASRIFFNSSKISFSTDIQIISRYDHLCAYLKVSWIECVRIFIFLKWRHQEG